MKRRVNTEAEQNRRILLRDLPIKRKKRRPKKDVVGMGRRWGGWRGAYSPTDHLNGPVIVRKLDE